MLEGCAQSGEHFSTCLKERLRFRLIHLVEILAEVIDQVREHLLNVLCVNEWIVAGFRTCFHNSPFDDTKLSRQDITSSIATASPPRSQNLLASRVGVQRI
jgi:hypothetical protein